MSHEFGDFHIDLTYFPPHARRMTRTRLEEEGGGVLESLKGDAEVM